MQSCGASCKRVQAHGCVSLTDSLGVSGVTEWMAAAYKPELAATLGSCMQDMMHGLKTGLEGQPNVTPAS
jgi:hypothetical protein